MLKFSETQSDAETDTKWLQILEKQVKLCKTQVTSGSGSEQRVQTRWAAVCGAGQGRQLYEGQGIYSCVTTAWFATMLSKVARGSFAKGQHSCAQSGYSMQPRGGP